MKNTVLGIVLGVLLVGCAGAWVVGQYAALCTVQHPWNPCGGGTIGTTNGKGVYPTSLSADPDSTHRTAASIEATYQYMELDGRWNFCKFRSSSTTDGDSQVYLILGAEDGSDYRPLFRLTFTTGTQTNTNKSTYEFADTLVETNNYMNGTGDVSSNATNDIAVYERDMKGIKKIAIVPYTVSHSAFLEITGY
jgi:hypothetical protein